MAGALGIPMAAPLAGSSIGVVAWDATVMIHGGTVQTGDAGNGGAGGLDGVGGSATAGAVVNPRLSLSAPPRTRKTE